MLPYANKKEIVNSNNNNRCLIICQRKTAQQPHLKDFSHNLKLLSKDRCMVAFTYRSA